MSTLEHLRVTCSISKNSIRQVHGEARVAIETYLGDVFYIVPCLPSYIIIIIITIIIIYIYIKKKKHEPIENIHLPSHIDIHPKPWICFLRSICIYMLLIANYYNVNMCLPSYRHVHWSSFELSCEPGQLQEAAWKLWRKSQQGASDDDMIKTMPNHVYYMN